MVVVLCGWGLESGEIVFFLKLLTGILQEHLARCLQKLHLGFFPEFLQMFAMETIQELNSSRIFFMKFIMALIQEFLIQFHQDFLEEFLQRFLKLLKEYFFEKCLMVFHLDFLN